MCDLVKALLTEPMASTLLSVLVGGAITWLASWIYYKKAGNDLRRETELLRKANMAAVYMLEHPDASVEVQRDSAGNPIGLIVSATGHAGIRFSTKGTITGAKSDP